MSDTETAIIEDLKKQEAELIDRASQLFASLDPADIARNLGFQYEVGPRAVAHTARFQLLLSADSFHLCLHTVPSRYPPTRKWWTISLPNSTACRAIPNWSRPSSRTFVTVETFPRSSG